jgi:hypothetical protein
MLNLAARWGNETWTGTKKNKVMLYRQERKFWQRLCSPVTEQGFKES